MTTIAYKDGIIAADTQLTIGDVKMVSADKINVLNNHTIFAAAGETPAIILAERFFRQDDWESKLDSRPDIPKEDKEDNPLDAILIYKGKAYLVDRTCLPEPLNHPFYAVGSGWKFAMAAMHSGLSAPDAVKFASELDVYTNDKIRYLNVEEVFKPKKAKATRGRRQAEPQLASEETPVRGNPDSGV